VSVADLDATAALELLDTLEDAALGLERAGDRADLAMIHVAFRAAHSLKGSLGLAGLESAAGLLHAIESTLDGARSRTGSLDEVAVDAILEAVSIVRAAVGSGQVDETAAARVFAALSARDPRSGSTGPGFNPTAEEAARASRAAAAGATLYEIDKLVSAGMSDDEAHGLPLFETLAGLGQVVARRLSRLGDGAVLSVILATGAEHEALSDSIFDPFYRLDPRLVAAAVPGTIQSALGAVRTTRDAELKSAPAARPQARRKPTLPSVCMPRILVVDDEDVSLFLCQRIAAEFGRVSTATDGPEAIAAFEHGLLVDPFQVVMLDVVLPSASGHEVLAALRRLERDAGGRIGDGAKVVMVSAKGDYDTVSAAFRAEADAYIVKPVSRERVAAAFAKLGYEPITLVCIPEAP